MRDVLIIDNTVLLDVINQSNMVTREFAMMLDILKELSYKVLVSYELMEEIYKQMYQKARNNDDVRTISLAFEKQIFNFISSEEQGEIIEHIVDTSKEEDERFLCALEENNLFRRDFKMIAYKIDDIKGLRNVIDMQSFKKVLLIFCDNITTIEEFVDAVKTILYTLCFDEGIVESIKHLGDGFDARKKEILHHLYCIDSEIPEIMKQNLGGYREIGEKMTIRCSPEADRGIVKNQLTKTMQGIEINCELHTKMKRLTSSAPDRIYFCPKLPPEIDESNGQPYIYKITKHV